MGSVSGFRVYALAASNEVEVSCEDCAGSMRSGTDRDGVPLAELTQWASRHECTM